jgi:hypothetical protein
MSEGYWSERALQHQRSNGRFLAGQAARRRTGQFDVFVDDLSVERDLNQLRVFKLFRPEK